MPDWIFQGNPDRFEVDTYLQSQDEVYWTVSRPKHQAMVSIDDHVFLWRAAGKKKALRGVVGFGVVSEECKPKSEVKKPHLLGQDLWTESEVSATVAGIRLKEVRLSPEQGMILASLIEQDPTLSRMHIMRIRTGSNFQLTAEQFSLLHELWSDSTDSGAEGFSIPGYSAPEGRQFYAVHKKRERDPKIVKQVKDIFREKHGHFFCEVCSSNPEEKYGKLGENLIEAHHLKPVHQMKSGEETNIKDVILVCPNCHRAIHKGDPTDNLEELKTLFAN